MISLTRRQNEISISCSVNTRSKWRRLYEEAKKFACPAQGKRRLAQGELAMRLGKVQSYIAKIEIGDRSLHIADLIQICRALNASPVRLLKEAIEKGYTI